MSARTPRRTFAHPFVVTLAAVPACSHPQRFHDNPPPPPPPITNEPAAPDPAATAPTSPPEAAPTPPPAPAPTPGGPAQAQDKAPDTTQRWLVTKNGATCLAQPKVECPRAAPGKAMPTCNPPAARPYPCPDGVAQASFIVVQFANAVHCVIEQPPPHCPPNASCNPPPPRRVECPK